VLDRLFRVPAAASDDQGIVSAVDFYPTNPTNVEQMAVSQWKLTRMEVVEVNIFKDTDAKSQLSMLDRLWQAECHLERSYSRAQRELERLQKSRPQPVPQPEEPAPAEAVSEVASGSSGQAKPPVPPASAAASASEIRNPPSEIHRQFHDEQF
jgi:hypothetical protein